MVHTVVKLESEDRVWLDRKAEEEQVPMAELVRRAVRRYREESDSQAHWRGSEPLELPSGECRGVVEPAG